MEIKNILNIKTKFELLKKIEFMTSLGIYESELIATLLMENYVFGPNQIDLISKQDIFNYCIKIYCDQIKKGGINSKFYLAEQLLKKRNVYLSSDKDLGEFLMNIAGYENSSKACGYFSSRFYKLHRKDLGDFWMKKSIIGCINQTGMKLNLSFNEQKKEIKLKFNNIVENQNQPA
ncbi:hypothetical protein [Neisseria dumasiana]|uniref:hypothetical protein n=1 Tax=Neisseria dumasiana TaxID=1931275 RepID=UPI000A19510E|nr:hypothetical protein [Neisseria dumasiana]OSI13908.1 hypothetical protein BV914_11430 [Neisseria dumasiana]